MSRKHKDNEAPAVSLKNESSRQRWELFHRAIAHAKESNHAALADTETHTDECDGSHPLLSIVR